jgi:hypothetical protein
VSGFEDFVRAVEQHTGRQGRRIGANVRLLCPAHDDHNPSLDVAEHPDGSPLVICRACGAGLAEVARAIGREPRDYLLARADDGASWTPAGPAVAIYDYVDEAGVLLSQVCRTADKQFPQRRPDPTAKHGWRWNLDGVRRVLYRLPAVIAAAAAGGRIHIVEGEKDVHAIERAGGVATCNPGGAGKWSDEYARYLHGAELVIVADRDEDGIGLAHARQIAASIVAHGNGNAGAVQIVQAASGKDAHDHISAGHGLDDFVALDGPATERPWRSQPWSVFRDESPEQHRWLIEGLLAEGQLAFIAAAPKRGKTWTALAASLSLALGQPLFGTFAVPEPRPVLYVALEGSRVGLRARIGALARGLGADPDGDIDLHVCFRPRPLNLVDLEHAGWLRDEAEDVHAALVVIDVLRAAARWNENAAEEFALIRDALAPQLDAGRTIALLHHFGKMSEAQRERSPGERMAGTGAMFGALDVGLWITRADDGARSMRIEVEARDFASPGALGVVITGTGTGEHGGFTYADTATVSIAAEAADERDLAAELEALFAADGLWRTVREAASKPTDTDEEAVDDGEDEDDAEPEDEARRRPTGVGANKDEVRDVLAGAPARFTQLDNPRRVGRHPSARLWGTVAMFRDLEASEVARALEPPEPPLLDQQQQLAVEGGGAGGSPIGEGATEPPSPPPAQVAPAAEPPPAGEPVGDDAPAEAERDNGAADERHEGEPRDE